MMGDGLVYFHMYAIFTVVFSKLFIGRTQGTPNPTAILNVCK